MSPIALKHLKGHYINKVFQKFDPIEKGLLRFDLSLEHINTINNLDVVSIIMMLHEYSTKNP